MLPRFPPEATLRAEHALMAESVRALHEGILAVSLDGTVKFMNAAAEKLTGMLPGAVKGRNLREIVRIHSDCYDKLFNAEPSQSSSIAEQIGWTLKGASRSQLLVHICIAQLLDDAGRGTGYLLTLRSAAEHLHAQTIAITKTTAPEFDLAPIAMVNLDEEGRIVRVNDALLRELDLDKSRLTGRSLTELSLDSDDRISQRLVPRLLGMKIPMDAAPQGERAL